ncbi:predicted protein [Uncinocarpus reesii 1704]|uniref:Uncharacterized protein n=1 Tax=Uncinocarpus reesii (strain UAMH 1704) TaxID=336963 RepID=C4JZZ3_UNCRE|nr:uncharacterized protein UREG_07744 [Uncinocarpus reesii 1704]EEP82879.1 predicted protein [Uncinocarpus reesii 1704]
MCTRHQRFARNIPSRRLKESESNRSASADIRKGRRDEKGSHIIEPQALLFLKPRIEIEPGK